MRQLFLEKADTSVPEFKEWFRNSKVVDDSGEPAVVYHATTARENFSVFRQYKDVGHHFGTTKAAQDRLDWLAKDVDADKQGSARYYPVYLSIQNPLELPDLDTWEPRRIMDILQDRDLITLDNPQDAADMTAILTRRKEDGTPALRKMLKRLRFDGIVYHNASEDKGSKSWVAFEPWQIKSVFNRGTWDRRRGDINE
jgi:hypothetical protein